jgi:Flp pilus assembly protein TadD
LDPHLSGLHYALGAALSASHAQADQTAAEGEYQKALADNPQDERAECSLGNIELKRSNWQAASVDFKHALQLQPGDPDANKGMGIVLMSEGSNAEAVTYLKRAVQADPRDESAYYHLSLASRNTGDLEAATRAMQEFQKVKARKDDLENNFRDLRHASAPQADGSQTSSPDAGPAKPPDGN